MKTFAKLFMFLAIVATITISNNAGVAQAKFLSKTNNLVKMDDAPQNNPQVESIISRMRRDVDARAANEDDLPKGIFGELLSRTRRQAPPGESDIPKEFQRAKRQMPSPPGEVPMPPI